MKSKLVYIAVTIGAVLLILLVITGIRSNSSKDQTTDMKNSSFASKDKKAGGAYAAVKMLPSLFGNRPVQILTKPFTRSYDKDDELKHTSNVYILVADELFATEQDVEDMLSYAMNGNELFIAVNKPDPVLAKKLDLKVVDGENFQDEQNKAVQSYYDPRVEVNAYSGTRVPFNASYRYNGMVSGSYFSGMDSTFTTVLGSNYKGKPNFVRIEYGRGRIFLLLNPYTFTNYFVLHNNNNEALAHQLSYMDQVAANIYWDDYYSAQHSARSGAFTEWQVLMRYPAMRWALWLIVLLMLLYVIFESKRRQRIIPDKPALANTSLEFVDALGQLYYQQHDNYNLAHKMILHLLEYIRNRYYINTNALNEQFVETLSRKASLPDSDIRELLGMIDHIQQAGYVSDEYLREFYKRIQLFYLNTK
ncbi:DUF4350 domain-containing protein [Chitinophaga vietnamensis]|uniref:DUF4350 domain-containing protein n=1 Tax=Chitinophaga vietnamensis TaxID=2593957 RepID=UPI0011778531|nr:DUF4350 domain-containing protein [Chitinophaga vietnamensis]